jgi:DNA-binding NarL/FixJ family response regulator
MHNQIAYVKHVMALGARGYVTKNSSEEEMINAINIVKAGDEYICIEIKEKLVKQMLKEEPARSTIESLSMREIEILKNLKEGLTSKEIASVLHISVRTVETHRHNVLKKLELKNTAALVNFLNNTDLNFI